MKQSPNLKKVIERDQIEEFKLLSLDNTDYYTPSLEVYIATYPTTFIEDSSDSYLFIEIFNKIFTFEIISSQPNHFLQHKYWDSNEFSELNWYLEFKKNEVFCRDLYKIFIKRLKYL